MTESMVERVAQAIREAQARPHSPDDVARAAIEAMREPPEEVGREAFNRVATDDWLDFLRGYRAMIDVALSHHHSGGVE